MTALELLESLNALDEHERIEAKRGQEIGQSIMETVCAFSNEPGLGGGHLLLGVAREELALFPAYEAVGVSQVDKLINDLASQCRTTFNTPLSVEIQQEKIGDKTVVVVFVPEVAASRKPIYFG